MRKHKVDFKKYADMHADVEVIGKDGVKVVVRTHIPYADKVKMAQEILELGLLVHDDSMLYEGHLIDAIRILKTVEYYTDVKTDDAAPEDVADFVINNELWNEIESAIQEDIRSFDEIYYQMLRGVIATYADDRCLTKAIRTSFGFLFNGEDITESLAKAEATKDVVYQALGALRREEQKKEKEFDDGTLSIGGNVISFAKR